MDRRDFLKVSGLSFALALSADGLQLLNEAQAATAQKINAWVRIAPDGTVTMLTAGSRAVMSYYEQLRVAGAQVRKVLIAAAAQKWNVAPASLRTEPGFV